MANVMSVSVEITANLEAIKDFTSRFESCNDGKYPQDQTTKGPHIIDEFGAKADLVIDRIGSKWVKIEEHTDYQEGDTFCDFKLESAWYPPSDMLKEMARQIFTIDPYAQIFGTYIDESFQPVGALYVELGWNSEGMDIEIYSKEENLEFDCDADNDNDDYFGEFWEEEVQPAVDRCLEYVKSI
jgi:hypothetical protein